jgi:hypothetical protein
MMSGWNPDKQSEIISSGVTIGELALNTNIPSLAQIRSKFGTNQAKRWLEIQLCTINDFVGSGKGMTEKQYEEISLLILGEYFFLNLAEFCYFVGKFKLGFYGEFYGAVDPLRITSALRSFIHERDENLFSEQRSINDKRMEEDIEKTKKNHISYEEYLRRKKKG